MVVEKGEPFNSMIDGATKHVGLFSPVTCLGASWQVSQWRTSFGAGKLVAPKGTPVAAENNPKLKAGTRHTERQ